MPETDVLMSEAELPLTEFLERTIVPQDFRPVAVPENAPRVYIQAQIHGNETTGVLVLNELCRRYTQDECPVQLRIVRSANPFAWNSYAEYGPGRLSIQGEQNWNRIFSGTQSTSSTSQVLTREAALRDRLWYLSTGFDVVIDLHTPEFGWPHIYAPTAADTLNTFSDVPHVLYGEPSSPAFEESVLRRNKMTGRSIRSVTLELPSHRLITRDDVTYWADRIQTELASYRTGATSMAPHNYGELVNLIPQISGVAYVICEPNQLCRQGEPVLGVMTRGGREEILTAPADCIPLCYRRQTIVTAGAWAVRVLALAS